MYSNCVEMLVKTVCSMGCSLQCTELVNVAMLTGRMQTHAMRIYAVSHSGRLSDVTSQTTCHSGDEDALKVCQTPTILFHCCTSWRGKGVESLSLTL